MTESDPRSAGCGGCNPGLPVPADALTFREWDAMVARHTDPLPLRQRIGERLASIAMCPACLLPRFAPSHWWTCR